MSRQLFWFGTVGCTSLATHFLIVSLLLVPLGMPPLMANVFAFLVAFLLSYWGHRLKTFNAGHLSHRRTLPRYFFVAGMSFLFNEILYFLLLDFTRLDYRSALLIVLFTVAILTFLLSKIWAFRGPTAI